MRISHKRLITEAEFRLQVSKASETGIIEISEVMLCRSCGLGRCLVPRRGSQFGPMHERIEVGACEGFTRCRPPLRTSARNRVGAPTPPDTDASVISSRFFRGRSLPRVRVAQSLWSIDEETAREHDHQAFSGQYIREPAPCWKAIVMTIALSLEVSSPRVGRQCGGVPPASQVLRAAAGARSKTFRLMACLD